MKGRGRIRPYDGPLQEAWLNAPYGVWRREFPGMEVSVPAAREWMRGLLTERIPAPLIDDALLLLSEVVTNAIAHSDSGRIPGGQVLVRVTCGLGGVHVKVTDGGSAICAPVVRVPKPDDDGGRGLWLVDILATAWGSHFEETGRSVWFWVARCRPKP